MDNVYTLNYLVERKLKKSRKVRAALVYFRAAFLVNREILEKRVVEEGISRRLKERI